MSPAGEAPGATRRDLILLAVCSTLLFCLFLGSRDLWHPNEPTYGLAVKEMAARGDWTRPTVNGIVFAEKPILYYWLALAAARLFGGVNEFTLRVPSALAGIATVMLVYLLVLPYSGRRRSWIAAALVGTTFIVFWSGHQIQMDLLLTAAVMGAVVPLTRVADFGLGPAAGWSLGGVGVGLGFLAKGPVALVCVFLPLALYVGSTGRYRRLLQPALGLGVVTFLAVAGPWYLKLWLSGEGEFLGELLWRQNFGRFVDPWDHAASWWYYLKYFWIDMLPWVLFLPLAVGMRSTNDAERGLNRLCWITIVSLVFFFSLSQSKRSPYILPVAPAMAVLVAGFAERWLRGELAGWRRRVGRLLIWGFVAGLTGAAMVTATRAEDLAAGDVDLQRAVAATAILLTLWAAALAVALFYRARPFAAPAVLFAGLLALHALAVTWVLPAVDARKSHRAFCAAIREEVGPDAPLVGYRLWQWRASYSYYSDRSVSRLDSLDDLRSYWQRPDRVFLIVERAMLDEARTILGPSPPLASSTVGHNEAHLFSNHPPTGTPNGDIRH